jgi:hypothetical protein
MINDQPQDIKETLQKIEKPDVSRGRIKPHFDNNRSHASAPFDVEQIRVDQWFGNCLPVSEFSVEPHHALTRVLNVGPFSRVFTASRNLEWPWHELQYYICGLLRYMYNGD